MLLFEVLYKAKTKHLHTINYWITNVHLSQNVYVQRLSEKAYLFLNSMHANLNMVQKFYQA